MKKILVLADLHDEDQRAYARACRLAKLTSSSIHVVIACYEPLGNLQQSEQKHDIASIKHRIVDHREVWWQTYLRDNPPTVEVSYEAVWEKYPHRWLLEHCKTRQYDLIVKSGHGSASTFHLPADWHLIRQAPIPLYSVGDKSYNPDNVILVALDLGGQKNEVSQLNYQLLEQGFRLSVQLDCTLHCCFAISVPKLLRDLDLIDVQTHVHKLKNDARQISRELLDQFSIEPKYFHLKEGTPERVIKEIASGLNAQCIVLGSNGRRGISAKLIGNTAEKVIHSAESDLLILSSRCY